MLFDLPDLLNLVDDLEWLEGPFSIKKIDDIIAQLPSDKSTGPDRFNIDFIKRCWPVIAQDFYDLYEAFYDGMVCVQRINRSYITLVPKKDSSEGVNDYRPISLLSSIKLITKLLADWLQHVNMKLIHQNQYGFIKTTRSVLVLWMSPYLSPIKERFDYSEAGLWKSVLIKLSMKPFSWFSSTRALG